MSEAKELRRRLWAVENSVHEAMHGDRGVALDKAWAEHGAVTNDIIKFLLACDGLRVVGKGLKREIAPLDKSDEAK